MSQTIYSSLSELNPLQTKIMQYVEIWVKKERTPVPLKLIIVEMERQGTKNFTTIKSINTLIEKRYIRRSFTISNKTSFVQLRRI